MVGVKLEPKCPKSFHGITLDPKPDWSLDALITELNALELKLDNTPFRPSPRLKTSGREYLDSKKSERILGSFVMRAPDDVKEEFESNGDHNGEASQMTGTRFSCIEVRLSDSEDSEDEFMHETIENHLMDKSGQAEGILFESEREHRLRVQEEIWNQFSSLEADLRNETERLVSSLNQVEKYTETRKEMDRRLDKQYQRKTAEALDSHLSIVQRDHEQQSQIEERRIRTDAAFEEAKKKEKALQEERARQEKAKEEAEARFLLAKVAEERKLALDAERKAEEAAKMEASANQLVAVKEGVQKEDLTQKRDVSSNGVKEGNEQQRIAGSNESTTVHSAGVIVKASESALKAENERLQKLNEVAEMNSKLKLNSNKDFSSHEKQVARLLKQMTGTEENFRVKASALIKAINDPLIPQSIFVANFAKQVVSLCESSFTIPTIAFACARSIVLVSSQVPITMDLVLAEFHKACIYTIPKHVSYSESAFKTKEAYKRAIGYREDAGKIESSSSYLDRVKFCMTLYAALVQTEINGIRNLHGLKEGWAWLARFLNCVPADESSAVALLAFLKVAGYMMFQKYKSQFRKVLNVITREFLVSLKKWYPNMTPVIEEFKTYIETNEFLREPKGWCLEISSWHVD